MYQLYCSKFSHVQCASQQQPPNNCSSIPILGDTRVYTAVYTRKYSRVLQSIAVIWWFNVSVIFVFYRFVFFTMGFVPRPKNHERKKWSNLGSLQVEGKGGVIPLLTWQPLIRDEVTCDKIHRIPYRWIAPGVSEAFFTKPQKIGPQRKYFGEPMPA